MSYFVVALWHVTKKPSYAQENPCFVIGSERIRLPVTSKIALHTAGRTGGNGRARPSPWVYSACAENPPESREGTCDMRIGIYWWKLVCMARPAYRT